MDVNRNTRTTTTVDVMPVGESRTSTPTPTHHHRLTSTTADRETSSSSRSRSRSTMSLLDSMERRTQRTYRYGIGLVCIGATLNWLGFAQGHGYVDPLRYLGVACVISGSFCVCMAMCRWLGKPIASVSSQHRIGRLQDDHENGGVHVINVSVPMYIPSSMANNIENEEYRQVKPPDYDIVVSGTEPPPYDEAIKLHPRSFNSSPAAPIQTTPTSTTCCTSTSTTLDNNNYFTLSTSSSSASLYASTRNKNEPNNQNQIPVVSSCSNSSSLLCLANNNNVNSNHNNLTVNNPTSTTSTSFKSLNPPPPYMATNEFHCYNIPSTVPVPVPSSSNSTSTTSSISQSIMSSVNNNNNNSAKDSTRRFSLGNIGGIKNKNVMFIP